MTSTMSQVYTFCKCVSMNRKISMVCKLFCLSSEDRSEEDTGSDTDDQWLTKYPQIFENRKYAPRDMLALLKNLDTEIGQYETTLVEEIEKRKKYKVICSRSKC